jgi:hypothetical protein
VEHRYSFKSQSLGNQFEHPLTNGLHAHALGRFALQRSHGHWIAIAPHIVEQIEFRIDVNHKSEARDSFPYGHANVNHTPAIHTYSGPFGIDSSNDIVRLDKSESDVLKFLQIASYRKAEHIEGQYRITSHLSGKMEHGSTSTTHPLDWWRGAIWRNRMDVRSKRISQGIEVGSNVQAASFSSYCNTWRVIANHHRTIRAIASGIVNQTPLECDQFIELQSTEQIRGQRPRRRGERENGV